MKRAYLILISDNTQRETERLMPAAAAKLYYVDLVDLARYWFAMLGLILGAPFRFFAAVTRNCIATGIGFFKALIRLFVGLIGIVLIGFVCYGILRGMLHLLSHH